MKPSVRRLQLNLRQYNSMIRRKVLWIMMIAQFLQLQRNTYRGQLL